MEQQEAAEKNNHNLLEAVGSKCKQPPVTSRYRRQATGAIGSRQKRWEAEQSKQKQISPFADIYESRRSFNTQAYMLVYIRAGMREKILRAPKLSEVPKDVSDFFDGENGVVDDMQRELDVHNECGVVYLIS